MLRCFTAEVCSRVILIVYAPHLVIKSYLLALIFLILIIFLFFSFHFRGSQMKCHFWWSWTEPRYRWPLPNMISGARRIWTWNSSWSMATTFVRARTVIESECFVLTSASFRLYWPLLPRPPPRYQVKHSLSRHMRHECTQSRRFGCTDCTRTFTHGFNVIRHLQQVHKMSSHDAHQRYAKFSRWKSWKWMQKLFLNKEMLRTWKIFLVIAVLIQ